MGRFAVLLLLASRLHAAESAVDIDTAAKIYQAAAVREQVRASLGRDAGAIAPAIRAETSPRKLSDSNSRRSRPPRSAAFASTCSRRLRSRALAENLDPPTVAKVQAFLASDLGRRMVAADVAEARGGRRDQRQDHERRSRGALDAEARRAVRETGARDPRSTESPVQIYLSHGRGRGHRYRHRLRPGPESVAERRARNGEASRAELEESMRVPMRKILAYRYRTLSDCGSQAHAGVSGVARREALRDRLQRLAWGRVSDAMGRRTGEQLGEALREMAQAQARARRPRIRAAGHRGARGPARRASGP